MTTSIASPGDFNFGLRTNTTYSQPINYQDSTGTTVNLSAYSAKMQIRNAAGTLLIELNTSNGKITLAATNPNITWSLSVSDIATIGLGGFVYDMVLFSGAAFTGTQTALLAGRVTVSEGITS